MQEIGCVTFRTLAGVGTNKETKYKTEESDTLGSAKMSNVYSGAADSPSVVGQINPILARLYHTHGIREGAVQDLDFSDRVELCDDVTRIIETSVRATDREMAADILISLLRHAEKNLKEAIAERFSVMDNAPLRLILQFVNDEIDVARPVLKYSKALNDLDLLYIIQSRESPFWQAIAARVDLNENVIEALADTKDIQTSRVLLENKFITLNQHSLDAVMNLAEKEEFLAEMLLDRSEVGQDIAQRIYAFASESLKQSIEEKFGALSGDVAEIVDDVISEFIDYQRPAYMPTASMLKAADLFYEQKKLNITLMLNTLKRGQMTSFVAQFSRYVHLPVSIVIPMLQQKNGQGLAIACKAAAITRKDFLMMFTHTRKMSGQNYTSAGDISAAMAYFDRVTPEVAKRLMAESRH